ncbi:MAG: Ig-like domain-containing protein [Bacteroidales bacterium]|nr:Ig-like domain-containing protein [Bacteroidales bacterium]
MKKLLYIGAAAIVALMSCSRETMVDTVEGPDNKYINITIKADRAPSEKTVINVPNRTLLWGEDELLAVYELRWVGGAWGGAATVSEKGVSADGGCTMDFKATFEKEANTSGQDLIYTAVYPASAMVGVQGGHAQVIDLASIQNDVEGSFDPKADLLLATQQPYGDQQSELKFEFERLVSLVRLKVKDINPQCYQVASVKLQTPGHIISGKKNLTLTGGFVTMYDTTEELANSVTVNVRNRNLLTSDNSAPADFDVWFCVWPETLNSGDTFTLTVTDINGREYTRTVSVSGSPLKFEKGKVTKFSVDMSSATVGQTVSSYYHKIQFPSGNPKAGITLKYDQTYKSGIRVYSYSDWTIDIKDGEGWLTVSDNYQSIGSCHVCGKGCLNNMSNTPVVIFNSTAPHCAPAPRVATVTVFNDTDEVTFTVTQEHYFPITGVTLDKSSYELEAGKTLQMKATVEPSNGSQYTLTYYSWSGGVVWVDSETGVVTGNVVGTGEVAVIARDNVTKEDFTVIAPITITEPDYPKPSHIYMPLTKAGYDAPNCFLVDNGVEMALEGGGTTYGITKAGGDIYITGRNDLRIDSSTVVSEACYWKNGAQTILADYDNIGDPVADGNDVYAIAHWLDSEGNNRYCLLKNWTKIAEATDGALWDYVAVENGDWYVAGCTGHTDGYKSCYWKNGVMTSTYEKLFSARCITVKNGKVYLGGSTMNTGPDAAVWIDGVLTEYSNDKYNYQKDYIDRILVIGDDVYAFGEYNWTGTQTAPRFYKNHKQINSPSIRKDNGNPAFDTYQITGAQEFGGLPYVLGNVGMDTSNAYRWPMQIIWKTLFYVPEYVNENQRRDMYGGSQHYIYSGLYVE